MITRSFQVSATELQVILPISQGSYLSPGSIITVSIVNVTVTSPAEAAGLAAAISSTDGTVQVTVADEVANIAVGFTTSATNVNEGLSTWRFENRCSKVFSLSIVATVNNVELTVFRRGVLGDVVVSWTTGTSTATGFAPGSLLPMAGTLEFPPQQNTTTLILTVS